MIYLGLFWPVTTIKLLWNYETWKLILQYVLWQDRKGKELLCHDHDRKKNLNSKDAVISISGLSIKSALAFCTNSYCSPLNQTKNNEKYGFPTINGPSQTMCTDCCLSQNLQVTDILLTIWYLYTYMSMHKTHSPGDTELSIPFNTVSVYKSSEYNQSTPSQKKKNKKKSTTSILTEKKYWVLGSLKLFPHLC